MKPGTTAVLIALLTVAGAVGVTWLFVEAPAPSNAVVERESPADERRARASMPPMEGAVEFTIDDSPVGADERPGVGNLVIALQDGAMFPLTYEQVRLRGAEREADEVIALTDHQGEAAFEGLNEGEYLYTVDAIGRPLLVASAPVVVTQGETTLLTLQVRDYDRAIGGWVLDRHWMPVTGLEVIKLPSAKLVTLFKASSFSSE